MRWVVFFTVCLALAAPLRAAPKTSFPYETAADADDVYVRSGPGSRYYPTGKLKRGQRVVVHRHDPGGWHMIAPPPGSFSWIPARYVEKSGGEGAVTANNVVVRVGSFESDIRELFQRKLSEGDRVQIVGEKELAPESGRGEPELWYRIAPPRGEWRWVSGQALAPPGRTSSTDDELHDYPSPLAMHKTTAQRLAPARESDGAHADEHFEPPLEAEPPRNYLDERGPARLQTTPDADELTERPLVRRRQSPPNTEPTGADSRETPRLDAQLEELDRLDARYRSILDGDPLHWDFTQLTADYRRLRDTASTGNLRQMIDSRLMRIDGHERTKVERVATEQVAQETLQRDAELSQAQRAHETRAAALGQTQFDGAGIVQRAALNRVGAPRYVLLAPSGRVLAYLAPAANVNLDQWVGRAAGVVGSRAHNPALRADLITVIRAAPVRLAE
ncbi:MAG: SH3 domain-containing protein [Planctomycetaceae bacterium]